MCESVSARESVRVYLRERVCEREPERAREEEEEEEEEEEKTYLGAIAEYALFSLHSCVGGSISSAR